MTIKEQAIALLSLIHPDKSSHSIEKDAEIDLSIFKGQEQRLLCLLADQIKSKYSEDVIAIIEKFGYTFEDVCNVSRNLEGQPYFIEMGNKGYLSNNKGKEEWKHSPAPVLWG